VAVEDWNRPPPEASATDIVTSWLPRAFSASSRRPSPDSPSVRLSLSGEGGGEWDLCATEQELQVSTREPGWRRGREDDEPGIWLRQSVPDFLALLRADPDLPALLPPEIGIMNLLCIDDSQMSLLGNIDGRLKLEVEGRRRRRWALDVAFGPAGMRAGRPRSTVRVDSRTCEDLASGTLVVLQALLAGRLQVEGDRALAMQAAMLMGSVQRGRSS
jgi:hypothetical protein